MVDVKWKLGVSSAADNRLIEESYQQEMAEQRRRELGEKAYEEEDGSGVTRPRARRRPASYVEPGQCPR